MYPRYAEDEIIKFIKLWTRFSLSTLFNNGHGYLPRN